MTLQRVGLALKRIAGEPADLYLEEDGNLAIVRNAEAVGQHVRQRLLTHAGEWFLDTRAGVPWLRDILGGQFNAVLAEAVIKAEVLDTDGVVDISSFSVRFDRNSRGLSAFGIEVGTEYDTEVKVS